MVAYDPTIPPAGPSSPPVSAGFRANFEGLQYGQLGGSWAANGELSNWPGGDSAAPAHFVHAGAGATIARTGTGLADTQKWSGDFAAKIVAGGGAVSTLTQTLVPSGTAFARLQGALRGRPFSVAAGGRCGSVSGLKLALTDGISTVLSTAHSGSLTGGVLADGWEVIVATIILASTATKLEAYWQVTQGVTAWCSGLSPVVGPVQPGLFVPGRAVRRPYIVPVQGTLVAAGGTAVNTPFQHALPFRVLNVRLACGTAPTGANVRVDVKKNGASMFSGTFPEVAAAATTGSLAPNGTYSNRCFTTSDLLTCEVTQVGSSVAGADLSILVDLEWYERPQQAFLGAGE